MKIAHKNGYIALVASIIISLVLVTVVISILSTTLIKLPMITKSQQAGDIKSELMSCVEESLFMLNEYGKLESNISIPQIECTVENIIQNSSDWNYDVKISKNSYIYNVKVRAKRTEKVFLDSLIFSE